MSDTTTTPAAPADEAPAAVAPAAPAAPVPTAPAAAPAADEKLFTQDEVNALIQARLDRATKTTADPSTDERIAVLEARAAASEKAAISAIVSKAAANAHDPATVAKLVDLGDLTSADAAAIETKVAEFLTANTYLVKPDAPAGPNLTPAPGVASAGTDRKLLTEEELDAITAEELAADDEKMALYQASRAALRA